MRLSLLFQWKEVFMTEKKTRTSEAADATGENFDKFQQKLDELSDTLVEEVKKHPLRYLAGAAVLGFVMGAITGRKSS